MSGGDIDSILSWVSPLDFDGRANVIMPQEISLRPEYDESCIDLQLELLICLGENPLIVSRLR
jgi:hypothetical protein